MQILILTTVDLKPPPHSLIIIPLIVWEVMTDENYELEAAKVQKMKTAIWL